MKVCVFAGTFDPLTKGHAFVIEKCLETFDKVVVAVGVNVDKTPMFTLSERVEMIKRAYENESRVVVETFSGMLVDFMKAKGITVNVRGIRNVKDYEYETTMERFNRDMYPELTTVFIPTPKELVHVSSSAMRNIFNLKGDASNYIPSAVAEYIKELKK
ncbi:MAG: pantetheine-phosphate adenylyltransferase [Clostridia bacterium]|nr:pantetheine-phosphate adenylyltransferase [Clostridia bacterium]